MPVYHRVPCLVLLLFNSNVNDLTFFAGDLIRTKYTSDPSPMVLQYAINSDLSLLSSWFESSYLHIDATKTQAVAIGPSLYKYEFHK